MKEIIKRRMSLEFTSSVAAPSLEDIGTSARDCPSAALNHNNLHGKVLSCLAHVECVQLYVQL